MAYLDDIANLEILPYGLHFSCHLLKLSKMLMGNICKWLLQGNGAIFRVLAYCKSLQNESDRGLISCIVVVVFVFNVPPTVKVISRRGHGLKSHPTDW